ncbi:ribonuclease P protein subunit p38 [Nerophis lumbriciformis]|uniref:ribonuclease P protein subunit p38 n=1 Tax=Nerophis lumbriciformis TaxID=546530 RepID=UPI002ADF82CE|nr:ribonuclease P protein subunit p38-like [Nerophis lumbriciformis]XP_061811497.1 ribonuclease P protein subunit p38-like [Nerophis lumbriciformis]
MSTPGKSGGKKDKIKAIPPKTSFSCPFTQHWRPLPQQDIHFILATLKEKLTSMGLEKKEPKVFRPWKKKGRGKTPSSRSDPVPEASQDLDTNDSPKGGWTDVVVRRQLAVGINEVTKALERNQLKLVLVCKSVKPKHMTHHLIALSATRGIPACQVPRLSESVAQQLGLKSVLALGFRSEGFTDTVEAIIPKVPSIDVAWLQGETASVASQPERSKRASQKRKLDPECEESASSFTLHPLTVKRIVPNPAKKRKLKAKQGEQQVC